MKKQDIILTSMNEHDITNRNNEILLHITPYNHLSPQKFDSRNSYLKLVANIIWPGKNNSYDFILEYESSYHKKINMIFIGSEKNILNLMNEIQDGNLRVKISQLKKSYDVFFFSQIQDEDTYRWLSTNHKSSHLDFLKRIKDIATSLNLFKNLKNNQLYNKYNVNEILIDNSATNYAYKKGYRIISSSFNDLIYNIESTKNILLPSGDGLIPISFTNSLEIDNPIHAIIGKNGSGKSYHLKEYIKSYFKNYGTRIMGSNETFSRVILISNTIHDKDYTPSKVCRDKGKRSNYHLISNTSLKHYNNIYTQGNKITLNNCIEDIIFRELTRSGNFNKALISDEVLRMLNLNFDIIVTNGRKIEIAHSINEALLFFPNERNKNTPNSLNPGDIDIDITFRSGTEKTDLSSGQSTFLVKALSILMTIETNSLVIIEEPENFLHPSLLIKFMTILKKILIETNSCSVISTHSPLVLRELPKEQVTILNRFENITSHRSPTIETFGADTTELYQESFSELEENAAYRDTINIIARSEISIESLLNKYSLLPTSLLTKIINEWRRK
ncbi:AAA family ATPase [Serratia liquefaciens]|uniref:AAA family ATPase n=1 Tax=Serratia liquefaciens TaxID=614 RepID=UPI003906A589